MRKLTSHPKKKSKCCIITGEHSLTCARFVDDLDVIDQGPVAGDLLALTNGFANVLAGDVVNGAGRPSQPMLWTTTMRSAGGRRRQLGKFSPTQADYYVDVRFTFRR